MIGGSRSGSEVRVAHPLLAALILSACAQEPETIMPTPVSGAQYQGRSCPQLGHDLSRLDQRIAVLSTEQRAKRVNDVVGWIFLLSPLASVTTKDIRPQLALYKGEREAVERIIAQQCSSLRS